MHYKFSSCLDIVESRVGPAGVHKNRFAAVLSQSYKAKGEKNGTHRRYEGHPAENKYLLQKILMISCPPVAFFPARAERSTPVGSNQRAYCEMLLSWHLTQTDSPKELLIRDAFFPV